MTEVRRTDFCTECRKETEYILLKTVQRETIREKEYEFNLTTAICKECGTRMNVPGLMDRNAQERDIQYREAEDIIKIDEIKKLMEIYHIGKAPLSLALGFGEITISRYLEGQIPSKAYSVIMRKALSDPEYMEGLLIQNREKVGETAYRKASRAAAELKELFQVSEKMLITIAYIFQQMQEITPLALQKILYYIQAIYLVLFDELPYPEECKAWVHGPVYEGVYCLFRDFKFNPIEDNRFALLAGKAKKLGNREKRVIDLVISTFGMYSGKVLEAITHEEMPWLEARMGCDAEEPSNTIISRSSMKGYFTKVNEKYGMGSVEGLNKYIESKLSR